MHKITQLVAITAIVTSFGATNALSQASGPVDMRAPEGRDRITGATHPTVTQSDVDKKQECPAMGCTMGGPPTGVPAAPPAAPQVPCTGTNCRQ